MRTLFLAIALLLVSGPVWAQEPDKGSVPSPDPEPAPVAAAAPANDCPGGVCVANDDLAMFVDLAREQKCRTDTPPTFDLDPVTIVVDKEGRVFYSGAEPHPYTVRMKWCNYEVKAEGKVDIVAAMMEPPIWGFRFRPKAYMAVLPLEALYELGTDTITGEDGNLSVGDLFDAGVMVDFLYYDWLNLNVATGFRSFGGGLGADLTSNFGAYLGYANTWGDWHHNVGVGLWFSFWNPD